MLIMWSQFLYAAVGTEILNITSVACSRQVLVSESGKET